MGKKAGRRLPNFCLNRIRPLVRVRSPPQPILSKSSDHVDENVQKCDQSGINIVNADQAVKSSDHDNQGVVKPTGLTIGRKIMIVVDSSNEAKAALQWSLSHHTVQSQDKLVLLHVIKPSNKRDTGTDHGESKTKTAPRACHEAVHSLKKICQQKRPEVELEVAVVEATEKGPAIVEEARKQGAALLILGQRKRSMTWRLIMMWAGNRVAGGGGVVEYCIQNANCMAIAVRRKSNKQGGYLITTKRHKDFWLLA